MITPESNTSAGTRVRAGRRKAGRGPRRDSERRSSAPRHLGSEAIAVALQPHKGGPPASRLHRRHQRPSNHSGTHTHTAQGESNTLNAIDNASIDITHERAQHESAHGSDIHTPSKHITSFLAVPLLLLRLHRFYLTRPTSPSHPHPHRTASRRSKTLAVAHHRIYTSPPFPAGDPHTSRTPRTAPHLTASALSFPSASQIYHV